MIIRCPSCHHDMEAPDSAIGKKVKCPTCTAAFTAELPKAQVIDDARLDGEAVGHVLQAAPPPPPLEPPPPGFADYPGQPAPEEDREPTPSVEQADGVEIIAESAEPDDQSRPQEPDAERELADGVDIIQDNVEAVMADAVEFVEVDAAAANTALSQLAATAAGQASSQTRRAVRQHNKLNLWYILSGPVEYGPYTGQAIVTAALAGKLSPGLIIRDGTGDVELRIGQLARSLVRSPLTKAGHVAGLSHLEHADISDLTEAAAPADDESADEPDAFAALTPGQARPDQPASDASDAPDALARRAVGHSEPEQLDEPVFAAAAAEQAAPEPADRSVPAAPAPAASPPSTIPIARAAPSPLNLTALFLGLTSVALGLAAAMVFLPWLAAPPAEAGAPSQRALFAVARHWATALLALQGGGVLLSLLLQFARRWHGRKLLSVALALLCLAALVVHGLALRTMKLALPGGKLDPRDLAFAAWAALAAGLVALTAAAIAAVRVVSTRPRRVRAARSPAGNGT